MIDREGDRAYVLRSDLSTVEAAREDDRVRMLPMFDAYTLAALPQEALVPRSRRNEVYRKGAWVSQVVTRGGRVVGVWTHERKPRGTDVDVKLFDKSKVSKAAAAAALEPYLPFIGKMAKLSVV
jgi:Winged helix DNA-binding domain